MPTQEEIIDGLNFYRSDELKGLFYELPIINQWAFYESPIVVP